MSIFELNFNIICTLKYFLCPIQNLSTLILPDAQIQGSKLYGLLQTINYIQEHIVYVLSEQLYDFYFTLYVTK
jgi:hypothetical protein